MRQIFIGIISILLGLSQISEGCTGIKLTAKDGKIVQGRTFEFGVNVDTSVAFIPQRYAFTSTTPLGKGLSYQAKYCAVGTICFNVPSLMDGMNEKGLTVGTFYFPGFAEYTKTSKENRDKSLSPVDFPNWLLTQFSTIDEVKKGVENVYIAPTVDKNWGNTPPPFHYLVYDKSGKSIAIEPIKGKLLVYDNPIGILTNSPNFEWHMTNLRNYINLTPKNVAPLKIDGTLFAPFGQGSGMVGLPGDFTPPSRFVRAAIFSTTTVPPENVNDAVFQAFHVLNQFDIPIGIARQVSEGVVHSDYTLATVVHDPYNLRYYFRTYEDQTIRMVDLNSFDKNGKEIKSTSTSGRQGYVDISNELKPLTPKM